MTHWCPQKCSSAPAVLAGCPSSPMCNHAGFFSSAAAMTSTQTLWAPGQKLQQLPFIQLPVPATARPQLLSRPQSHQYFSSPAWSVRPSGAHSACLFQSTGTTKHRCIYSLWRSPGRSHLDSTSPTLLSCTCRTGYWGRANQGSRFCRRGSQKDTLEGSLSPTLG